MKNKLPIALIGVIIILLGVFFLTSRKTTFGRNETQFAFESDLTPDEIRISGNSSSFSLILKNNSWYIDGETEARPQRVMLLIGSLQNLQMDYPVSGDKVQELRDTIKQKGTRVVFLNNEKEIYQLQLAGFNNKTIALNRKGIPFYISVKGYNNLPLVKVAETDKTLWSERLIINVNPGEIQSVQIKYKDKPEQGFRLRQSEGQLKLENKDGIEVKEILVQELADYTSFFRGISYENTDTGRYSTDFTSELFELTIVNTANQEISIKGLPVFDKTTGKKDVNNFVGIVNNSDTISLKYSNFDPIIMTLDNFLKK